VDGLLDACPTARSRAPNLTEGVHRRRRPARSVSATAGRRNLLGRITLVGVATATLTAVVLLPGHPPAAATGGPLFGVTIDGITHINAIAAAERALPGRATTRVYFDVSKPASFYRAVVSRLSPVTTIMGELLDSADATHISAAGYRARVESYLATLGPAVSIWEVGNEVNGNWTGPYSDGSAKLTEAYDDVAGAGGTAALTLYANEFAPDNCGDGYAELTPAQFSSQYVPEAVRNGLAYVFESYYPTQCKGVFPTSAQVATEMEQLHVLYPHALLGFGETGLPRPATRKTMVTAEHIMSWAYSLNPGLSYYVGGYFWWYARQDAFLGRKLLATQLAGAFEAEDAVLH